MICLQVAGLLMGLRLRPDGLLVLERHADEVAIAPDQPTLTDGTKIIEGQFKIQRQGRKILSANAGADVRNICDAA